MSFISSGVMFKKLNPKFCELLPFLQTFDQLFCSFTGFAVFAFKKELWLNTVT